MLHPPSPCPSTTASANTRATTHIAPTQVEGPAQAPSQRTERRDASKPGATKPDPRGCTEDDGAGSSADHKGCQGAHRTTKGGINRHHNSDQHSKIREASGGRVPIHGYSDKILALPTDFLIFTRQLQTSKGGHGAQHRSHCIRERVCWNTYYSSLHESLGYHQ